MVREEEIKIIRDRSLRMLRAARYHLRLGDYDLAAFMAEQAAQLFIKYRILELTGEIPRSHTIRELLGILGSIVSNEKEVREFIRKKRSLIIRLEDAYIASRYLFRKYEKEESEELVDFAEEVMRFVENL